MRAFFGSSLEFLCVCLEDPHGELQGQNVLIVRYSLELTAAHFGLSVNKLTEVLASARAKLAEVRRARPPPHLDTKMLASWNGMFHMHRNILDFIHFTEAYCSDESRLHHRYSNFDLIFADFY